MVSDPKISRVVSSGIRPAREPGPLFMLVIR